MLAENKQLVRDWIAKKLSGQGNPFDDLDPQIQLIIPGSEGNPLFSTFSGLEEFTKALGLLSAKVTQTFKVIDCIAEGDRVVALIDETLTRKDDPSQQYLNHTAWLFRLSDRQKIVFIYTYDDTLLTSKALA